jgi:hypothetical protein
MPMPEKIGIVYPMRRRSVLRKKETSIDFSFPAISTKPYVH